MSHAGRRQCSLWLRPRGVHTPYCWSLLHHSKVCQTAPMQEGSLAWNSQQMPRSASFRLPKLGANISPATKHLTGGWTSESPAKWCVEAGCVIFQVLSDSKESRGMTLWRRDDLVGTRTTLWKRSFLSEGLRRTILRVSYSRRRLVSWYVIFKGWHCCQSVSGRLRLRSIYGVFSWRHAVTCIAGRRCRATPWKILNNAIRPHTSTIRR